MKIITVVTAFVCITGMALAQAPQGGQTGAPPPSSQPSLQGGQGMQGHLPAGGDMRMRMAMHGDFALGGIEKQLNMTDDQKKQFTQILADVDTFRRKTFQDNAGNLDRFFTQFKADKMNADTLKQVSNDMEKVYKETAEFVEKKLTEFHDMLTPEQRKNITQQVTMFIKSRFFHGME
ncbi:MAG TPA: Spy/CpxP family protein refolding chaperone [Candidatus Kapabacteria bacterium]|nr:Spy/CpxP family protein refolding chaperone [Candidatus Kapabacteria bacterium]